MNQYIISASINCTHCFVVLEYKSVHRDVKRKIDVSNMARNIVHLKNKLSTEIGVY